MRAKEAASSEFANVLTALDQVAQRNGHGGITLIFGDVEFNAVLSGGLHHVCSFGNVERYRFFDQDVFSSPGRLHGDGAVQSVGQTHGDRVDVGSGKRLAVIDIGPSNAEFGSLSFEKVRIVVDQSGDRASR